jgi:hypothetical protein
MIHIFRFFFFLLSFFSTIFIFVQSLANTFTTLFSLIFDKDLVGFPSRCYLGKRSHDGVKPNHNYYLSIILCKSIYELLDVSCKHDYLYTFPFSFNYMLRIKTTLIKCL